MGESGDDRCLVISSGRDKTRADAVLRLSACGRVTIVHASVVPARAGGEEKENIEIDAIYRKFSDVEQ